MKIVLIILSIIGLLKLVSLLLIVLILSIKNNLNKEVNGKLEKHYYSVERSMYCGLNDWIYFIPTIKSTMTNKFFELELDVFMFYISVSYNVKDLDEEE